MKKILSIILTTFLILTSLAGCGENISSAQSTELKIETSNGGSSVTAAGEKANLDLWFYWDGAQQEILIKYLSIFNEQSQNVNITATFVPYSEYTQKVLTSAASGTVPDILIYGNNETATLAEAGILNPMTQAVKDGGFETRVLPEVLKAHEYNGEYYGLPIYANCLALFYNKALVPNPPKTWDELKSIAAEVTTDDCYALAVSAIENEEGVFQFLPWLWSAGADLNTISSAEGIEAMTLYRDMVEMGYMSKEVISWSQQDVMTQFSTGRAVMMINGPWNVPPLKAAAPDLDFGITVLPALKDGGSSSILGGESFGVAKGGNVDAASEFFNWIYSAEIYTTYIREVGMLPAEKSLLMDSYYQNDPIQKAFADNLLVAKPRAYGPAYNEMSKAIQTAITATLSGLKSPEEAMQEAATVIDPLLK